MFAIVADINGILFLLAFGDAEAEIWVAEALQRRYFHLLTENCKFDLNSLKLSYKLDWESGNC